MALLNDTPTTIRIVRPRPGEDGAPATQRAHGWLRVDADFHQRFIDDLKAAVPWHERAYSDADKEWAVAPAWEALLCTLALRHFDRAWLLDEASGARIDLVSGQTFNQLSLFPPSGGNGG